MIILLLSLLAFAQDSGAPVHSAAEPDVASVAEEVVAAEPDVAPVAEEVVAAEPDVAPVAEEVVAAKPDVAPVAGEVVGPGAPVAHSSDVAALTLPNPISSEGVAPVVEAPAAEAQVLGSAARALAEVVAASARIASPAPVEDSLLALFPRVPFRGLRAGIGLWFAAALMLGLDHGLTRLSPRLASFGLLPALHAGSRAFFRFLSLLLGLLAVAAWVPEALAPALPVLLLTAAIALGWSVRDLLPDWIAGLVLVVERRVRRGRWMQVQGHSGMVEHMGVRATWLRDPSGRAIAIPNRQLLAIPLEAELQRWPSVDVTVQASGRLDRRRIAELAVSLPWVASEGAVVVTAGTTPNTWSVRIRLLEAGYFERFRGALQDLIDEAPLSEAVEDE